jgi:thiamine biosynthesis lipoprotein
MKRRMRPLLGTFVEIGFPDGAEEVASQAFASIEVFQNLLSFHSSESDLTRLNRSAGEEMELHPISVHVLRLARAMSRASEGLFNPTVGGKMIELGVLPDHGFGKFLSCGSADDLQIKGRRVRLRRPVILTLDGIAKGAAVDAGIKTLRRAGLRTGWINAGGDLRVFGETSLPISLRNSNGALASVGVLKDAAMATSSVQETWDPRFPGRIVSSFTDPHFGSWTVVAKSAWRADALTKVAATAHPLVREERVRWLGGHLVRLEKKESA